MNKKLQLFALTIIVLGIFACKKNNSDDGENALRGCIIEKVYNKDYNVFQKDVPAEEERVYLFSGDDSFYSYDTRTSADGTFQFDELAAGGYTVMYYSEDSALSNRGETVALYKKVTVGSGTTTIDTLYKFNSVNYDKGSSSITGKVLAKNYTKNFGLITDTTGAADWDVYLVYNNRSYYEERIRALFDGTFSFPNLIKGHYLIYVYSENTDGSKLDVVVKREVDITEENKSVNLENIYVNHENE
jgi:hypothetical protein